MAAPLCVGPTPSSLLQLIVFLIVFTAALSSSAIVPDVAFESNVVDDEITRNSTSDDHQSELFSDDFADRLDLDEILLAEARDFDPTALMNRLIHIAQTNSTPPKTFAEEVRQIVNYKFTGMPSWPYDLIVKYNVSDKKPKPRLDSDMITPMRLILTFPHLYSFGLDDLASHNKAAANAKAEIMCPFLNSLIPTIMKQPEFGGLIPPWSEGSVTDRRIWRSLIKTHLHWLYCISDKSISFQNEAALLRERIEASTTFLDLCDRIFKKNGILTDDGLLSDHIHLAEEAAATPNFNKALEGIKWIRDYD